MLTFFVTMKLANRIPLSIFVGIAAAVIGLSTFLIHWFFWEVRGGPLAGYNLLLGPGNLALTYIWHPLFTEELSLAPKVALMLFGQFALVSGIVEIGHRFINRIFKSRAI